MKNFLLIFCLIVSFNSYSQTGMYIVTEKWDNMIGSLPTFDSVYITNPSGNTTGYSITHLMLNTFQHDNDFHALINPIINQGYRLFNSFLTSQNNNNLTPQFGEYHIFWFAQP
jgi:hypothetical protein